MTCCGDESSIWLGTNGKNWALVSRVPVSIARSNCRFAYVACVAQVDGAGFGMRVRVWAKRLADADGALAPALEPAALEPTPFEPTALAAAAATGIVSFTSALAGTHRSLQIRYLTWPIRSTWVPGFAEAGTPIVSGSSTSDS